MLFFQAALLLGYVYSHVLSTRVRARWQGTVHTALLAASVLALPVSPGAAARFAGSGSPVIAVLSVLTVSAGLPYFMLATTTPLIQAWYSRRYGASPYRLFAVSNAACLLALTAYPTAVETLLPTSIQLRAWSVGYVVFAFCCAAIALGRGARGEEAGMKEIPAKRVGAARWTLWLALPACASALLLAVTHHLSEDVAPVPLLWVVPLAAYLLSFILCFGSDRWWRTPLFRLTLPVALGAMLLLVIEPTVSPGLGVTVLVFTAGLFTGCMALHGELAALRPGPEGVTSYYFAIALGGVAGSAFVALAAPVLYASYAEIAVAIAACAMLCLTTRRGNFSEARVWRTATATLGFALVLAPVTRWADPAIAHFRNFYGAFRVTEIESGGRRLRKLFSGTTLHGGEFTGKAPPQATTYYGAASAIGRILRSGGPPRQVGVIGLGVGTVAAYARMHDRYRFYELNPGVIETARTRFTFLRSCRGVCEIVPGDARLSLEREAPQGFDVMVLDAFSGDAVPVHLLTAEAFRLYFRHMKPDGILAVHVSNRYLDLAGVVAAACEPLGKRVWAERSGADPENGTEIAHWVVVVPEAGPIRAGAGRAARQAWTDDYSNLLQVMRR